MQILYVIVYGFGRQSAMRCKSDKMGEYTFCTTPATADPILQRDWATWKGSAVSTHD